MIFIRVFSMLILFSLVHGTAGARTCETLFVPQYALASKTLERVNQYQMTDRDRGVPKEHRTEISIVRDSEKRPIKTAVSVLLIHGLFNSPAAFAAVAAHFHAQGMNVINLRLDGHYESDLTPMHETVRWQRWLKDGRKALKLAHELGDTVLLAGHSTGALTTAWLAVENPVAIRGLALFAPAFRVRLSQQIGARVLEILDIDMGPSTRLISGHAGSEVTEMANGFARLWGRAPLALSEIPVWMANTGSDATIDIAKAEDFFSRLNRYEPGEAARLAVSIPVAKKVLHSTLAGERNPEFPALVKSMDGFFGFEPP